GGGGACQGCLDRQHVREPAGRRGHSFVTAQRPGEIMTQQKLLSPQEISDLSLRLGQRIRSARAARAMTMRQLALESDISLPYLSRVEKGDGNISLAVLYRLAA